MTYFLFHCSNYKKPTALTPYISSLETHKYTIPKVVNSTRKENMAQKFLTKCFFFFSNTFPFTSRLQYIYIFNVDQQFRRKFHRQTDRRE